MNRRLSRHSLPVPLHRTEQPGSGGTDDGGGTPWGLGNLIVGYDEARDTDSAKTGSHNLVVGSNHNYEAVGGLIAGYQNAASGPWASVSGGRDNTAIGDYEVLP